MLEKEAFSGRAQLHSVRKTRNPGGEARASFTELPGCCPTFPSGSDANAVFDTCINKRIP
jgi:hypothetical protein